MSRAGGAESAGAATGGAARQEEVGCAGGSLMWTATGSEPDVECEVRTLSCY